MADCVTVRESETTRDLRRLLGEGTGALQSEYEFNSPSALPTMPASMQIIESALNALRQGKPVIVLDDQDRENEGDL
ncbi:MAG: 3,4-dihydroxy-2-butanone-4-phosphate synthase, partial [Alphaproteobacteria bacterium]